jgi:hypothetical protein
MQKAKAMKLFFSASFRRFSISCGLSFIKKNVLTGLTGLKGWGEGEIVPKIVLIKPKKC